MEDRNWDYTRAVIAQSEPRPMVDPDDDDEELSVGSSLMRSLMAAAPAEGWVDSGSGPGYASVPPRPKLRPDRDKLS